MTAHTTTGRATDAAILARAGGATIAYRRHVGENSGALPGIVFLSGFASDMTGTKATALHRFAEESGQNFVRFDYQGHGASSGKITEGGIETWRDDALAVLDELTDGPQILVGSSMGGWIMQLVTLARPDRVAGLVGIATATDFSEALLWANLSQTQRREVEEIGFTRVTTPHDPKGYKITRNNIEEGRRNLLLGGPIPIHCPVRLFHGTADTEVPWKHSTRLIEHLQSTDVTLTLVKDGDHRLSTDADLKRFGAATTELAAALRS